MKIAYKRVSTEEQNLDRQLAGLEFEKEFVEKVSGKNLKRAALIEMLDFIREGDHIFVHELFRLGRNTIDLHSIVKNILDKKASVTFVKENIHFSNDTKANAIQNLMFSMLCSFSEFERSALKERQKEGIEQAKKRGVYLGRKSKLTKDDLQEMRVMFDAKINRTKIAEKFGLTRRSVYRLMK